MVVLSAFLALRFVRDWLQSSGRNLKEGNHRRNFYLEGTIPSLKLIGRETQMK